MNLFKKKQNAPSAEPIDKNLAIPGITNVIKLFGNAQKKMEPDFIPIYLYVMDSKTGNSLCYLSTTFFAKINNHPKHPEHGFSIFFNKTILEDNYDTFVNSNVAKVFAKEKGIIDSPGRLHERCEFYIKDFGYDAKEASAIIAMLLDEVFKIRLNEITLQIQLFGCNEENEGEESTAEYDCGGNKIAKSGFSQEHF